jgi:ATP-dependent Clp protease ATP-binding subunit ClpC
VLAAWTGIPVYRLTEEETAKLLRMEDELHKRVVGQEEALRPSRGPSAAHGRGSRTPSAPAARSSSSGPRAWGRPNWPRPWRSSSSTTRTR